ERTADWERALAYARRGVALDPLRETAQIDLIRLLAATGQPAAALDQYRELERLFREHLGAELEPGARTLARQIERLSLLHAASITGTSPVRLLTAPTVAEKGATHEREIRPATLLGVVAGRWMPAAPGPPVEERAAVTDRLLQAIVAIVLRYEGRID